MKGWPAHLGQQLPAGAPTTTSPDGPGGGNGPVCLGRGHIKGTRFINLSKNVLTCIKKCLLWSYTKAQRGKAMKQAVCYIRVSTEEQVRGGVSLAAQEEKLLTYCALVGLEPMAVIREEGVSGGKPLAIRPGGGELLALVGGRKTKHVVALKLDRLFRDAADALNQTRAWDKAGVALHLVDMGGQTLNTATAMGRFFLNIMAGFAELERNLIAERTEMAMAHKKAHRQAYAPTPYGYDREGDALRQNPGELKVVAQMRQWRAAGWTLGQIARELSCRRVPTKRGGAWYPGTVKYLLENNLYAGMA